MSVPAGGMGTLAVSAALVVSCAVISGVIALALGTPEPFPITYAPGKIPQPFHFITAERKIAAGCIRIWRIALHHAHIDAVLGIGHGYICSYIIIVIIRRSSAFRCPAASFLTGDHIVTVLAVTLDVYGIRGSLDRGDRQ